MNLNILLVLLVRIKVVVSIFQAFNERQCFQVATSFVYDPYTMWVNMNNVGMTEGSVGVVSVWSSKVSLLILR